ncbi:MAG: hypothetical protein ACXAC7_22485 [Candidatus Hodarchaeales archaeon]|jgi:hypothetical protein
MEVEYIERFAYRKYTGLRESRWKRVWALAWFEIISTWHKTTIGKIFFIILIINNFIIILSAVSSLVTITDIDPKQDVLIFLKSYIRPYFNLSGAGGYGLFIIPAIMIAGSGYFADDRQGQLFEVYLTRLTRREYMMGKLIGMILFTNIFTTLPLILTVLFFVHGTGEDHLQFIEFYFRVIIFGIMVALLLGLLILLLSSIVEKRAYASLSGVLIYIMGSLFGGGNFFWDPSNDFLLLLSTTTFISLLGHSLIGDNEFVVRDYFSIYLNDGMGLEAYHVIGIAIVTIIVIFLLLIYRIQRLTNEEI